LISCILGLLLLLVVVVGDCHSQKIIALLVGIVSWHSKDKLIHGGLLYSDFIENEQRKGMFLGITSKIQTFVNRRAWRALACSGVLRRAIARHHPSAR